MRKHIALFSEVHIVLKLKYATCLSMTNGVNGPFNAG